MNRFARSSSVCWNCTFPCPGSSSSILAGVHGSRNIHHSVSYRRRAATPSLKSVLTGDGKFPAFLKFKHKPSQPIENNLTDNSRIRQQLREWLRTNDIAASPMPPDSLMYGNIANNVSRTQCTGSSELDQLRSAPGGVTEEFEAQSGNTDAEVSSVGSDMWSAGDLVELRQHGSRVPVFAIYLGYFGARNHFYAVNGKWITSMGFSSLFTVSNFATHEEMRPLLAKIPQNGIASPDIYDELRRNEQGPSREDGVAIIEKMTQFRLSSDAIYQQHMNRLDSAHDLLADKTTKYLSLFEVADALLPATLKADQGFPPAALYAVHSALSRNDMEFNPLSPSADCHRREHMFEVFPSNHTRIAACVAAWVRQYTDLSKAKLRPLNDDELKDITLGQFIFQAREAVSRSRQTREWTPHGILKTSPSVTLPRVDWCPVSKEVITFLEWWASYDLFDTGSRYHAYGALILRSLELYPDAPLNQSTAWTLLQEMGVIAPWEIPSRYKVRLPGTTIERGGGVARPAPKQQLKASTRPDIAKGGRKSRKGSTTFCIDAPSTVLIDDGISLEHTDRPDEFWIHVHAADPASEIRPKSELATFMELIPDNIYLPGHFQAMLPSGLGDDSAKDYTSDALIKHHSLRPGAPALTFSALVNESGDVLDYQVAPSTLDHVTYLDPDDVSEFCGQEAPPKPTATKTYSLDVGTPPDGEAVTAPERPMTSTQALDESSKADLLTLSRLAQATREKRLAKGAWPYFFPRPSVQVSFHEAMPESNEAAEGCMMFPPDPYIKVGQDSSGGCSVVSSTMVLAGEIAARWCSARGIPIPYRRDAKSAENLEAALSYATREMYPLIRKGIEPSASQRQELLRLTGEIQLSTEPGPYFLLGLDMYAKTTSPLRRFADLVTHWQIHAALAHERKTRRAMDPSVDDVDAIVPFSRASLDAMLPQLHMREKMGRTIARGTLDWILIALVRAWRFEGKTPSTLRFTVSSCWRQGLVGRLDMFDLNAAMDTHGLNGCILVKDVQVGDEFEVELAEVNVHSRQILVKALRHLGQKQTPAPS
ncbi:hypothetical protein E4U41_005725 [Claviceps citrina]|nr:hypothetical protein E4U41_005725 [Claviceps citrina]